MTNGDRPLGPPLLGDEGSPAAQQPSQNLPASPTPRSPQNWGAGGASHARAALSSPDAAERVAALAWLGAQASGSFTLDDLALLHDPDLMVRAAAVVALRAASDAVLVNGARLALRTLVEGDAAERHAGLRAAATIGNPTLAPRLLPFLAHAEPETRRLTLLALAAVPPGLLPATFLPDLLTPLLADPDPGVRATAEAILHSGGRAEG
jgi:hypothetical protein